MYDKRPYCVECSCRMVVDKNEVKVPYSGKQIQYGDRYKCPNCTTCIIIGFGEPIEGVIEELKRTNGETDE